MLLNLDQVTMEMALAKNHAALTNTPENTTDEQKRNCAFRGGLEDSPDQKRSTGDDHRPAGRRKHVSELGKREQQ